MASDALPYQPCLRSLPQTCFVCVAQSLAMREPLAFIIAGDSPFPRRRNIPVFAVCHFHTFAEFIIAIGSQLRAPIPVPPLMTIYGTMYVPNYAKIGGKIRGRTRIREIRVFKKKGVFFRPKL